MTLVSALIILNFQKTSAQSFKDDEPDKKVFAYVHAGRGSITESNLRGVIHVLPASIKFFTDQTGNTSPYWFYIGNSTVEDNMDQILTAADKLNKFIIISLDGEGVEADALLRITTNDKCAQFARNLRSYLANKCLTQNGKRWIDIIDGIDIDWEYPPIPQWWEWWKPNLFNRFIDALQTEFSDKNFLWTFAVAGSYNTGSDKGWDYNYLKYKMGFCNLWDMILTTERNTIEL